MVSAYQWFITIGILLASVINNATQYRTTHASYQIPIAVQFVWAVVLMVGMVFLPEVGIFRLLHGPTRSIDANSHRIVSSLVDQKRSR